jgi:hypothetical protein
MKKYFGVFCILLLYLCLAGSARAQYDPFGEIDQVYVDSVEAGPGRDVVVNVSVRNDEILGSASIPLTYDPTLLALQEVSFAGSRTEYLATKIVNPEEVTTANGHFVVALIKTDEAPVAEGDGMVFSMRFTVSPTAEAGQVAIIDTLFYPPAGKLLLVEWDSTTVLKPNFRAGKVVIGGPNRAPVFATSGDEYVLEGDSLVLDIRVDDPDGDDVTLAATAKPVGATFMDNGDGSGRLTWVPDFVGPTSSSGSPFVLGFRASDGDLSADYQTEVQVINKNRPPTISSPDTVFVNAGHSLEFTVSALDPDFEDITWTWSTNLAEAAFSDENPGLLTWQSQLTDTGTYPVDFIASDPHGFTDTSQVIVKINPATLYVMRLDTLEVFPGEETNYEVVIDNLFPITAFNILFNYDASTLTLLDVTNADTRSESFEYFNVTYDDNGVTGNTRLVGIADQGGGTPALAAGAGSVATLRMRATGDLSFSGMLVPIRFRFEDTFTKNDNTLSDTLGDKIGQTEIVYQDGYIRLTDIGEIKVGDINLNGLAAEISDVIYFTNYLINPVKYPFTPLQYANSDVNGDGLVATVSDLVTLINMVVGGGAANRGTGELPNVSVNLTQSQGRAVVSYNSDLALGGAFVSLKLKGESPSADIVNFHENMTLNYVNGDGVINLIIYSLEGGRLPAGNVDLFEVDGGGTVEIDEFDLSTTDGRLVSPAFSRSDAALPRDYALHQNYPNPFNPETKISFDLPQDGRIRLLVYNILGRQVKLLLDDYLPAGTHTVAWDGTDDHGRSVASGVYLYRLEAEAASLSRKMMLLK